jgi:hypothetical protein
VNFADLDWQILDRLRDTFLSGRFKGTPYWRSARDLDQYDQTLGERIGWKWDSVLDELKSIGWCPPETVTRVVDWACGSGIAGRRVLNAFPGIRRLHLIDHSGLAVDYARDRARTAFPGVEVSEGLPGDFSDALLVISHVLNELDPAPREELLRIARASAAILWVESGTHETARALQSVRDQLVPYRRVIAPCTHSKTCPLLQPGMERHWCHHFGNPPAEAFTDGNWARFADRAGIDLRSLPYAFLAMDPAGDAGGEPDATPWVRILGRAQVSKPSARVLVCGEDGAGEQALTRRDEPELYRAFKKGDGPRRIADLKSSR